MLVRAQLYSALCRIAERACDKALILFSDPQLLFFGCDFYLAAICTFFISAAECYQAVNNIMRGSRDRYWGRSICFGLKDVSTR